MVGQIGALRLVIILEKPTLLLGKPFRKNPFCVWENLFFVVGRFCAYPCAPCLWSRWLFLRLVLGGSFCVLVQTASRFDGIGVPSLDVSSADPIGKTPLGEKTFIIIRKNPWPCGKTFTGKNSL